MVSRLAITPNADAQIIYLALRETTIEVVTFVNVPGGTEDLGMLLPVPAVPTLTLDDLSDKTLISASYDAALAEAVAQHASQAFVAEGVFGGGLKSWLLGPRLSELSPADPTLTRLSTRLPATALNADVEFGTPREAHVPNERTIAAGLLSRGISPPPGRGPSGFLAAVAIGFAAALAFRNVVKKRGRPNAQIMDAAGF